MLPHEGSFLESDVPHAAYLYNSPLRGMCTQYWKQIVLTKTSVRVTGRETESTSSSYFNSPFIISGARNVFLETMKRGEDDDYASGLVTIILRLYEAFGGHSRVLLKVAPYLPIAKAFVTNLLEDEKEELDITLLTDGDIVEDVMSSGCSIALNFRGFEVKTLKLVIGAPSLPPPSSDIEQE